MKHFIDDDFLLDTAEARELFHGYAGSQPIIDYHCHLSPKEIAQNRRFDNLAQLWLGGDHYKWRAMRARGVSEDEITGRQPDYQTFLRWASTLPYTYGNPLYHWAHLELLRYFDCDVILKPETAKEVWDACSKRIAQGGFSTQELLKRSKVEVVCTTDDPVDSLEWHAAYASSRKPGDTLMFPTFRPDKALAVANPVTWNAYLDQLSQVSGLPIRNYDDLVAALDARHAFFHEHGCALSDHAIQSPSIPFSRDEASKLFNAARAGAVPSREDARRFQASLLVEVGEMNHRRGWAMQLHVCALRNLNSRAFASLGPDTGYDAIADEPLAEGIAATLDAMSQRSALPRTILYSLNANHNDTLASIMGCFQEGNKPGWIQLGSAWWFNDHLEGMKRQIEDLAHLGLLRPFVGMLTDSRSFLSFPRHEYFRRILCSVLGGWMAKRLVPHDLADLGDMAKAISYTNARDWFAFPRP